MAAQPIESLSVSESTMKNRIATASSQVALGLAEGRRLTAELRADTGLPSTGAAAWLKRHRLPEGRRRENATSSSLPKKLTPELPRKLPKNLPARAKTNTCCGVHYSPACRNRRDCSPGR